MICKHCSTAADQQKYDFHAYCIGKQSCDCQHRYTEFALHGRPVALPIPPVTVIEIDRINSDRDNF